VTNPKNQRTTRITAIVASKSIGKPPSVLPQQMTHQTEQKQDQENKEQNLRDSRGRNRYSRKSQYGCKQSYDKESECPAQHCLPPLNSFGSWLLAVRERIAPFIRPVAIHANTLFSLLAKVHCPIDQFPRLNFLPAQGNTRHYICSSSISGKRLPSETWFSIQSRVEIRSYAPKPCAALPIKTGGFHELGPNRRKVEAGIWQSA
jgi:hypothetical protein